MRIMVVEDEELLRKGLISMIERMGLNCSIVASAENGQEALEKLSYISTDLIITDIRMPIMDGLQLLEEVAQFHPEIRSIILSGYADFEYVKRAMTLQSREYLLKPPLYDEFYKVLEKISNEYVLGQKQKLANLMQKGILNQNQYIIRTEFLRNFIYRRTIKNMEYVMLEAANIGIELQLTDYIVCVIQVEEKLENQDKYDMNDWILMKYAMHNIVEEMIGFSPCFYDEQDLLIVLFADPIVENQIHSKCKEILFKIKELLQLTVSIGIAMPSELSTLPEAYVEAKRLLKYRIISDCNSIISYSDVKTFTNDSVDTLIESLTKLFDLEHSEIIMQRLKEWYESLKVAELSWKALDKIDKETKIIFPTLLRHYLKEHSMQNPNFNLGTEIARIELADSLLARLHPILQVLKDISTDHKKGKIENRVSEQVIKYIKENYQENITLTTISETIYMNSAYLSVLFKKKMRVNL